MITVTNKPLPPRAVMTKQDRYAIMTILLIVRVGAWGGVDDVELSSAMAVRLQ